MKRKLTQVGVVLLLLLGTFLSTQAQNRVINGRVLNDKDEPLSGVSIVGKNAPTTGTTTSENGTFSLTITSTADSLVASGVGYAEQTVAISNDVQIRMIATSSQMEEVVVIGYGTQKKADLTASIST